MKWKLQGIKLIYEIDYASILLNVFHDLDIEGGLFNCFYFFRWTCICDENSIIFHSFFFPIYLCISYCEGSIHFHTHEFNTVYEFIMSVSSYRMKCDEKA